METLELDDLARIYAPPHPMARDKVRDHVDDHGRTFIGLSTFCVVSTAGADGSLDVSPRGGAPGFVHVTADGRTLFLPDRPGNNRTDILRNLLRGSGHIALMFMIPGFDDIYRVNGRAVATDDAALLADFVEFGKRPRLVLRIAVDEAFIHCPKAVMRARLWDSGGRAARSQIKSVAEMASDYTKQPEAVVIEQLKAEF